MTASPTAPRLGAHVSTAGGVARAFDRGAAIGCDALQIFVKSPNQWRGRAFSDGEPEDFRQGRSATGGLPVVAHAAYLINLAAPDPKILDRSRTALADELDRCDALGLDGLVVHPGAHLGEGVDVGVARIAASLDAVLGERDAGTPVLLELTAGQGTVLGRTLEELAAIRDASRHADRLAFCLDTCHAFAGGYDLRTADAVETFVDRVAATIGIAGVVCVHLNDSTGELGSRRDRHANIGSGEIGAEGFRAWLADSRLAGIPSILETPLGDDELGHGRDLERLRELLPGSTG